MFDILLLFYPDLARRPLFGELCWQNPPSFASYWRDIERARRTGYAIDVGNYHAGITTVAAAIPDCAGIAAMALSAIALSN